MPHLTALDVTLFGVPGALGALLLYFPVRALRRERATRRWPRAPGTITSSSVKSEAGSWTDQQGEVHETMGHTPCVTYELTVGGRTIQGANLQLGTTRSRAQYGDALRVVQRYPVGAAVQVFHDPADPTNAFLETGAPGGLWVLFMLGGIFFSVGLVGVVLFVVFFVA